MSQHRPTCQGRFGRVVTGVQKMFECLIANPRLSFHEAIHANISCSPARTDLQCDYNHLRQEWSSPRDSKICNTTTACDNYALKATKTIPHQHVVLLSPGKASDSLQRQVHQSVHQHLRNQTATSAESVRQHSLLSGSHLQRLAANRVATKGHHDFLRIGRPL